MDRWFLMFLLIKYVESQMGSHVLGGEYTNINNYPHAVFLDITSGNEYICGGSILNQDIVLTAAHCFDDYKGRAKDRVIINYGASVLNSMSQTIMKYYRIHDQYKEISLYADISLLRSKTKIKLGQLVKRVVIMKNPPNDGLAYVSGWGIINDQQDLPKGLKHTKQRLRAKEICKKYLNLPVGTFCAGPITGKGHPNIGDSGGALMIKQYIQIGIVSFKEDDFSVVAYTNVSHYFNWIKNNAVYVFCAKI